jgi:hypothetical protein
MDKVLFEKLVASIKEAGAIARGEAKPSRRFALTALKRAKSPLISASLEAFNHPPARR